MDTNLFIISSPVLWFEPFIKVNVPRSGEGGWGLYYKRFIGTCCGAKGHPIWSKIRYCLFWPFWPGTGYRFFSGWCLKQGRENHKAWSAIGWGFQEARAAHAHPNFRKENVKAIPYKPYECISIPQPTLRLNMNSTLYHCFSGQYISSFGFQIFRSVPKETATIQC